MQEKRTKTYIMHLLQYAPCEMPFVVGQAEINPPVASSYPQGFIFQDTQNTNRLYPEKIEVNSRSWKFCPLNVGKLLELPTSVVTDRADLYRIRLKNDVHPTILQPVADYRPSPEPLKSETQLDRSWLRLHFSQIHEN